VPYLKFSRDKRGYENFSLVEPSSGRRKSSRPRVLFWFRTPPQIKVGREPFPDEVRRAIEAQNPGLTFDWPRLMATPIPAPDAEHWRERRRAEKAARQAMRESEHVELDGQEEQVGQDGKVGQEVGQESDGDENSVDDTGPVPADVTLSASESTEPASVLAPESVGGRRRRRRGRRRRHQTAGSSSETTGPASEPVASNVPVPPSDEV
jgi:hypothetical protein